MALDNEEILKLLKQKGPLVPNEIKKILGGDTILFGAMLSELSSRGFIKISNLKMGSSPFYYLPGQETMLEKLTQYLNPKDQKTVAFLKEHKVVQDKRLELFQRVSLRQIKDFALPLNYQTKQGVVLFWRYYLISETKALQIITDALHPKPKEAPQVEVVQEKKAQKEIPKQEVHNEPEQVKKVEESKAVIKKAHQVVKARTTKPSLQKKQDTDSSQQHLVIKPELERTAFYERIITYFKDSEISLLTEEQISKDREYDFVIQVPSGVGSLKMLCRARNKKKLNEGDVAPALLRAKTKDLPCLFLTTGVFTKKSLELIHKEYPGLIIKKI